MTRFFLAFIGVLISSVFFFGHDNISEKSRLTLIREVTAITAVTKLPIPRGKHGFFLGSDGKIDEEKNASEFRIKGRAMNPGTPIQITKVRFKKNRVVFDVNGGGKNGKKWYQRISVSTGSGPVSSPVSSMDTHAPISGAFVSLTFDGLIPDLSVAEFKKLLEPIFDFKRRSPTTLYSPEIPEKYKKAIRNKEVLIGMNRDTVISSKGTPDRRIREFRDGIEFEEWIYGIPPNMIFVTFDIDIVTEVKKFNLPEGQIKKPSVELIETNLTRKEP